MTLYFRTCYGQAIVAFIIATMVSNSHGVDGASLSYEQYKAMRLLGEQRRLSGDGVIPPEIAGEITKHIRMTHEERSTIRLFSPLWLCLEREIPRIEFTSRYNLCQYDGETSHKVTILDGYHRQDKVNEIGKLVITIAHRSEVEYEVKHNLYKTANTLRPLLLFWPITKPYCLFFTQGGEPDEDYLERGLYFYLPQTLKSLSEDNLYTKFKMSCLNPEVELDLIKDPCLGWMIPQAKEHLDFLAKSYTQNFYFKTN